MATSGTYNYTSIIADMFDEAVERAGVDPSVTGGAHIKSGFRSLRFMLNSEWSNIGVREWQITEGLSHTVAVGEVSFLLPLGYLDITQAVLRRPGSGTTTADVEMYPITRQEYVDITNKSIPGRPDRYFVDRQFGQKIVYYWQAGSNTTDQIVYNAFHQNQDITGSLAANLDIPTNAYAALVAGWSAALALKWNPAKYELLQTIYRGPLNLPPGNPGGLLGELRMEDRERGDIDLYPAFEPRTGRR